MTDLFTKFLICKLFCFTYNSQQEENPDESKILHNILYLLCLTVVVIFYNFVNFFISVEFIFYRLLINSQIFYHCIYDFITNEQSTVYSHPHKNVSTFTFWMGFQGLLILRESGEYILIAPTYGFSILCINIVSLIFKIID